MKSFSKAEIQELLDNNNVDEFKQAILDSKGFILYLADKHGLQISPNLLIDSITPYSIRFITQHMESHPYTKNQKEIVVGYLVDDSEPDLVINKLRFKSSSGPASSSEYTIEKLVDEIKSGQEIPSNIDLLLKITFDDFQKNATELIKLVDKDPVGQSFFINNSFLENLFNGITKEDFSQIDKGILIKCPSLFHMANHLMGEPEIKALFNETVDAHYNAKDNTENNKKPTIHIYGNYVFDSSEKDLFMSLINNSSSHYRTYDQVYKSNGFDVFFTKKDYILNHSIVSLNYIDEQDILDNLPLVRDSILKEYFTPFGPNKLTTGPFRLYEIDFQEDVFDKIFTPNFIKECVYSEGGFDFKPSASDNDIDVRFVSFLNQEVLALCAGDADFLKFVGYQECIKEISDMQTREYQNFNKGEEFHKEICDKIIVNFSDSLDSDFLLKNFNNAEMDCYLKNNIPSVIFEQMAGKISINYLFALMNISSILDIDERAEFTKEINRIIPLLNPEDVKEVSGALDYPIDIKSLKDNPRQEFSNNFLNFTPEIIKALSLSEFKAYFELSDSFRTMILDNDLDYLLIDDKYKSYDPTGEEHLISSALLSLKDKDSKYYSFTKSFIEKNKEFILANYFNKIVIHPLRFDLISLDTTLQEQASYQKIKELAPLFLSKELEYTKIVTESPSLHKDSKTKPIVSRDTIYKEKRQIEGVLKSEVANVSFDFFCKKFEESSVLDAIDLAYAISWSHGNNLVHYNSLIFKKIKSLDLSSTKDLLSNVRFLHFIMHHRSTVYAEEKDFVRLQFNPNFSNEESKNLIETLMLNANNPSLHASFYNKKFDLFDIVHLVNLNTKNLIFNDLAIKLSPLNMFNVIHYAITDEDRAPKYNGQQFSNEQILQAIENLNNQGLKIISHKDGHPHNFFKYLYKNNSNSAENPKLESYLSLLKNLESDPINYLACIDHEIVNQFLDPNVKNNGLLLSGFYEKHINFDVVLKAMHEIFEIYKNSYKESVYPEIYRVMGSNSKNDVPTPKYLLMVEQFIASTFSTHDNVLRSEFSDDKSKKMLSLILKEAPYLVLSTPSIGNLGSLSDGINIDIREHYHENFIEHLFLNSKNNHIEGHDFSLDYDYPEQLPNKIADNLIKNLISFLTEERDFDGLYKLSMVIDECLFNSSRAQNKKLEEFESWLSAFLVNDEYLNIFKKSLSYVEMLKLSENLEKPEKVVSKTKKI